MISPSACKLLLFVKYSTESPGPRRAHIMTDIVASSGRLVRIPIYSVMKIDMTIFNSDSNLLVKVES